MLFKLTPASVPALSYGYGPSNAHTHTRVCVCVCVCVWKGLFSAVFVQFNLASATLDWTPPKKKNNLDDLNFSLRYFNFYPLPSFFSPYFWLKSNCLIFTAHT